MKRAPNWIENLKIEGHHHGTFLLYICPTSMGVPTPGCQSSRFNMSSLAIYDNYDIFIAADLIFNFKVLVFLWPQIAWHFIENSCHH